jgi:hypothetical protein
VRTRVPSAAHFLVVLTLLLGFLAGCGGGGEQSGSGESQGGGEQGGAEQGGGEAANQQAPQQKIALGTIKRVKPDRRKVVLKPTSEAQGGEQMTFNVRKNAEIRVNDQDGEMADIQSGQSAQIEYVTKNEVNRAVAVEIVGDGG